MKATFLDEAGNSQRLRMGCYGIGITPHRGAAIEAEPRRARHHLPEPIAPFHVAVLSDRLPRERRGARCRRIDISRADRSGFEVLLDDRDERPGAMFADMELIGNSPSHRCRRTRLKEGMIEYQGAATRRRKKFPSAIRLHRCARAHAEALRLRDRDRVPVLALAGAQIYEAPPPRCGRI